jgi:hypothetical protein
MRDTCNFTKYVSKVRYVHAIEIDKSWLQFLTSEKGHTGLNIGDYYVKQDDGNFIVLSKQRFERLFEIESNSLQEANDALDKLVSGTEFKNV